MQSFINHIDKRGNAQILFWAFLGPFLTLITLFIILIKAPLTASYLALAALLGIPLCLKWKVKGLIISSLLLSSLFVFELGTIPTHEQIWHYVMGFSVILGFVVTALASSEAEQMVSALQEQASAYFYRLLVTDEKLKEAETYNKEDYAVLARNLEAKELEATEQLKKILYYQQLTDMAREELISLNATHEQAQRQLVEQSQQQAILAERLEFAQEQINTFNSTIVPEKTAEIQALKTQLRHCEQIRIQGQSEVEQHKASREASQKEMDQLKEEIASLKEAQALCQLLEEENKQFRRECGLYNEQTKRLQAVELERDKLTQESEKTRAEMANFKQEQERLINIEKALIVENEHVKKELQSLAEQHRHLKQLESELKALRKEKEQTSKEMQSLQEEHRHLKQLESELKALQKEREGAINENLELKALIETLKMQKAAIQDSQENRTQAMYAQLRQQFEAKNEQLAEARRSLFHAQEKIEQMQREHEEQDLSYCTLSYADYQKMLAHHIRENQKQSREWAEEVDNLHSLISTWFSKAL